MGDGCSGLIQVHSSTSILCVSCVVRGRERPQIEERVQRLVRVYMSGVQSVQSIRERERERDSNRLDSYKVSTPIDHIQSVTFEIYIYIYNKINNDL